MYESRPTDSADSTTSTPFQVPAQTDFNLSAEYHALIGNCHSHVVEFKLLADAPCLHGGYVANLIGPCVPCISTDSIKQG